MPKLVEKSKNEVIQLLRTGEAYLVELREHFPGDTYVFSLDGGKWMTFRNGELVGYIETRDVIRAIITAKKTSMVLAAWEYSTKWVDPFIKYSNAVLNVLKKPFVLQLQLTDGPNTITTYEMPVRKTNVFDLVVLGRERKFDIIEYNGRIYTIIGWDQMKIKGKYVFRLTLDQS